MPIGTNAAAGARNPWDGDPVVSPAAAGGNPWDGDPIVAPAVGAGARYPIIRGPEKPPEPLAVANYQLGVRSADRADDAAARTAAAQAQSAALAAEGAERDRIRFSERNQAQVPAGYRFRQDGNLEPIPGGPADKSAPATAGEATLRMGEAKAAAFLIRALGANKSYEGAGVGPRGYIGQTMRDWAPDATNFLNSNERQVSDSAQDEFIAATLRQDSGAAIPDPELERQRRIYFPMAGDGAEAEAQKRMARIRALQGLAQSSGHGVSPEQRAELDALTGGGSARAAGTIQFGDQAPSGGPFSREQEKAFTALAQNGGTEQQLAALAASFGVQGTPENLRAIAAFYRDPRHAGVPLGVDRSRLEAAERADAQRLAGTDAGAMDLIVQGGSFGLADEVGGIANAATRALGGDFDLGRNYRVGRDAIEMRADQARKDLGWVGTAAEVGGGMLGLNPGGALAAAAAPGLGARMAAGAKAGAAAGGVAGFGYGRGAEDSLGGAALGAAAGATIGAALPAGGEMIRSRVAGARRMAGGDSSLPSQIIGEALDADGVEAAAIGQRLREAAERGSPLAVGDTGENARSLLASVGRHPGTSRTTTRDTVVTRQMEQGDRIDAAATRDLGAAPNVRNTGDELIARAREQAAPLYEQAYAAPNVTSAGVEGLLSRPSMRSALARAFRIAEEEGRDPRALGLLMDDAGNVVLNGQPVAQQAGVDEARRAFEAAQQAYRRSRKTAGSRGEADVSGMRDRMLAARQQLREANAALDAAPVATDPKQVPQYSWQTLDYVKRGIDDVLEARRDPVTSKLVLDEEGRAINSTLRTFLNRVDKANPAYGQARAVYAGPARMKDALEKGAKAVNTSADELEATIAGLAGEPEREMFRQGYRKAISEVIESRVDGGDKVQALLGTAKKRRALYQVFGGRPEFDRFIATLGDERAMNDTYRAVNTGSATAERQLADAQTADGGILETAVDAGIRGAKKGQTLLGMGLEAAQKLREVERFGVGEAGKRTRQAVAERLTSSDPAAIEAVVADVGREQGRRRASAAAAARRAAPQAQVAGRFVGAGIGSKRERR